MANIHDEDRIVAWYGLHLDHDAKAAVQAHEGIVAIKNSAVKRRRVS